MSIAHGIGDGQVRKPRVRGLVAIVFVVLALSGVATAILPTEPASAIGAAAMIFGMAIAGYIFVRKAPLVPVDERGSWRLLGSGLLLISGGVVVLGITVSVTDYAAAFGPPDLLFLAGYLLGIAGMASLPHATGTKLHQIRLLIDGVIGAIALTALLWVFFYSQVTTALADSPTWERVVGSIYPLFDMMLLVTLMIVIVRRSSYRYDPRLVFIAVGGAGQVVADMAFLLSGAGKSFTEADPVFPLHILAIASFLAAATIVDRPIEEREYADRPATPLWAMALPYGTTAIMVIVLAVRVRWTQVTSADTILLFATLGVGGLVVLRQAVAIRENRRFVENQQTTLVASISHELRTPLTAVVGFLELLDREVFDTKAERLEVTRIASKQATYLSRIVSDLVMLASDSITAMELDVSPIPLDELVWSSVNSAAVDPSTVRVDADRGVVAFLDQGRMEQALANLLSNATKYGGDSIVISAVADGGDLVLEVHDDGEGVPRKYELLVWEKFERGPNRLNATVPGSGIGLAVTNAIIKAHGGAAGYRRSERLGGACFWIRLPGRVKNAPPSTREAANLVVLDDSDDAQTA